MFSSLHVLYLQTLLELHKDSFQHIFFFFLLTLSQTLGVGIMNQLPPLSSVPCILFLYSSFHEILFYFIIPSYSRSSSPSATSYWLFPRSLYHLVIFSPHNVSKPSQSSNFHLLDNACYPCSSSDFLISNFVT